MRYRDSIFGQLLKPLSRRAISAIAAARGGEAYDKSFRTWDHLIALIYAQLSGARSLRALEAGWNANSHHHYHLGTGRLARATLADASRRRPAAIFAEIFSRLSAEADRGFRKEGAELVRLIDSSPIPLGEAVAWRAFNGRIKGGKLHMVYEPGSDRPCEIEITPANVNDVEIGKRAVILAGMTYVFDKGYCSYAWWSAIHVGGALFVTRLKSNARCERLARRKLGRSERQGDGFEVVEDADIRLDYARDPGLDLPVRRIRVRRDTGEELVLVTNDLDRPAAAIARLYRTRWQIELLFRWIKQNLNVRAFLGRSENAIKLQIFAAMTVYLLLRLAARASRSTHLAIRFAELVGAALFVRKPLSRIDKPPEVNASKAACRPRTAQLELGYP